MKKVENFIHPYIPNSVPSVKKSMLEEIGVENIEDLYADIPDHLRFNRNLDLPEPLLSEYDLRSHMEEILSKNSTCEKNISFLGGGCWQHYVPAICDEIIRRSEFLTAYAGEPYEDHGRFQVLFEYESLMGEVLDMDVVNVPTYDWSQAAATALMMAGRLTGRREILISENISPERLAVIRNYCLPVMRIKTVNFHPETGKVPLSELEEMLSKDTACYYFENPGYFGVIEDRGETIADMLHKHGALSVVGTDPISLGILKPPAQYGADIVCGDIQALGGHLAYGGNLGGFIASRDEENYVMEFPSRLFGLTPSSVPGEWGFGDVAYERTSFAEREKGKEFVGTHAALCGITAAVYLSLLGPLGLLEIGKTIVQKAAYTAQKINALAGVRAPKFNAPFFKEFVVDFNGTGKTVKEINRTLLASQIFGGKDLSEDFPGIGQCALYCVTEMHTEAKINRFLEVLERSLTGQGEEQ